MTIQSEVALGPPDGPDHHIEGEDSPQAEEYQE